MWVASDWPGIAASSLDCNTRHTTNMPDGSRCHGWRAGMLSKSPLPYIMNSRGADIYSAIVHVTSIIQSLPSSLLQIRKKGLRSSRRLSVSTDAALAPRASRKTLAARSSPRGTEPSLAVVDITGEAETVTAVRRSNAVDMMLEVHRKSIINSALVLLTSSRNKHTNKLRDNDT